MTMALKGIVSIDQKEVESGTKSLTGEGLNGDRGVMTAQARTELTKNRGGGKFRCVRPKKNKQN